MTVHAARSTPIARPPAEVFRWIADPDLASRWQPSVTGYEITRRTDDVVGTEFVETIGGDGGTAELRGRIVAYRPGELVEFDLIGPGMRVHARYSVRPTAAGAMVAADVAIVPARRVPSIPGLLLRARARRELGRDLDRLRLLCERAGDDDTKEASRERPHRASADRRS